MKVIFAHQWIQYFIICILGFCHALRFENNTWPKVIQKCAFWHGFTSFSPKLLHWCEYRLTLLSELLHTSKHEVKVIPSHHCDSSQSQLVVSHLVEIDSFQLKITITRALVSPDQDMLDLLLLFPFHEKSTHGNLFHAYKLGWKFYEPSCKPIFSQT